MISKDGWFSLTVKSGGLRLVESYSKGEIVVRAIAGATFTLALTNSSRRRAMAIVNIDGLCIIDGLELAYEGLGYILEPGMTIELSCWRMEEYCPELAFGRLPEGFENQMDVPTKPGVIEALFFFEQAAPYYTGAFLAQSGFATQRSEGIGWSGKPKERIVREQFAKEASPISSITIRYLTRQK